MNKQELINVPRILFPIGTEILIKGKIVGLMVLDDRFVENVVKLDYGEQIIAPNDAIYVKDERQPVKVPQFVADWIESYKREIDIRDAMSKAYVSVEVDNWLMEVDADGAFVNQDLFAHAWLDGYEVEEEKRYIVKIKNLDSDVRVLKKRNRWYFGGDWGDSRDTELKIHTRKQLEEADFGWVFDCPGIEIEEVE